MESARWKRAPRRTWTVVGNVFRLFLTVWLSAISVYGMISVYGEDAVNVSRADTASVGPNGSATLDPRIPHGVREAQGVREAHGAKRLPEGKNAPEVPVDAAAGGAGDASVPIELRSYRIKIHVCFADDPTFGEETRRGIAAELRETIDRHFGQMWTVDVSDSNTLLPHPRSRLSRLTVDSQTFAGADAQFDKVFVVAVEASGSGVSIAVREWDATSHRVSPMRSGMTSDARDVVDHIFKLLRESFRPLFSITPRDTIAVSVRAQAGELLPADPELTQLQVGGHLEPFLRYLNKDLAPERRQALPWTYLRVDEVVRSHGNGKVVTGMRSPLSPRRRRRVEPWAIATSVPIEETELTVISRSPGQQPLIGYEVELIGSDKQKLGTFVTDRRGSVLLPTPSQQPQVWLMVRSGQTLLAALPFVPGCENRLTAELSDDSARLSAEGRVAMLQADLVDVVARRALLSSTLKQLAKKGDWKRVDEQLRTLKELPKADKFEADLNHIRVPALFAARSAKDRALEARLLKLSSDTSALIKSYLEEDKLKALYEELDELKRIHAEQNADAAAAAKE